MSISKTPAIAGERGKRRVEQHHLPKAALAADPLSRDHWYEVVYAIVWYSIKVAAKKLLFGLRVTGAALLLPVAFVCFCVLLACGWEDGWDPLENGF